MTHSSNRVEDEAAIWGVKNAVSNPALTTLFWHKHAEEDPQLVYFVLMVPTPSAGRLAFFWMNERHVIKPGLEAWTLALLKFIRKEVFKNHFGWIDISMLFN